MIRVIQPALRRCSAAACIALMLGSAAMGENVSFGTRPRYNGIPGAGSNVVVYNLPASGSVAGYFGPVNATFDLTALVEGGDGSETAAGFGLIANVAGTGQVVFNPPAIVGDANNLFTNTLNTAFPANTSFDYLFATTGVQGGGNQEIDITAFEEVALQNNVVSNGQGLLSVPIQVGGGVTGSFNVNFNVSANYTGFVKTIAVNNTQFLTNAGSFPHVGTTVVVRESRRADMNGDSFIDGEDIAPFISVLSDTTAFRNAFPWLQVNYITDLNQDTAIDGEDIAPFIAILSGGGSPSASPSAVPEPSTVFLALVGSAGLYLARRRCRK